jgi:thiamine-phosphate pyrophosphorylase
MKGYYFITDSSLSRAGNLRDVRAALCAGVKIIQYRQKHKDSRAMYLEAAKLKSLCAKRMFLVNNRIDLALAIGASGVHLGQDDLPCSLARRTLGKKKIIGITVHSLKQALDAVKAGADYLAVSPIFQTRTKPDAGTPRGVALIRRIKKRVRLPLVAIGGINLANAGQVVAAGADCLCAISAVVAKKEPQKEIKKFQELFYRRQARR